MSLFNFFKSRDKPKNDLTLTPNEERFFSGGTTGGKRVTEDTALQISAVYACVKIISEAIASLPLHVFTRTGDGGKTSAIEHPLYLILHDEPNPEMTSFMFRETLVSHLLLWGNAYAQIIRNGKGEVVALYPLLPSKIQVSRDSKTNKLVYKYTDDRREFILSRDQILHIAGLGYDGIIGYSPISMARNAISMTMSAEEYGTKFFDNGAKPGGVLEHPNVIKNIDRLRESWNKQYQGSANSNKIAILEEGLKYHPIGVPPEDAQFLETRKFQINEIARIFRVPPHMVGDLEKSSFSNIEQQSLEFVKYTLNPWITRWEQALHQSLLLPSEKPNMLIRFNLEGLLRGDYKSRMDGYAVGFQNGFYSANDIRRLEDMNLLSDEEGGNNYVVNGNMIALKDVGAAYNTKQGGEKY